MTLKGQMWFLTPRHISYVIVYPTGPKFSSVSLYDEPFLRYRSVYFRRPLPWQRSRKFWRVDKNMLYGSKHTPQGPNFHPFRSTMSRLKVVGDFKIPIGKQWLIFKILILLYKVNKAKIQNSEKQVLWGTTQGYCRNNLELNVQELSEEQRFDISRSSQGRISEDSVYLLNRSL